MTARLNLLGCRFGRLTVTAEATSQAGRARWVCRCDCGHSKTVIAGSLKRGLTKSCGCLHDQGPPVRSLVGQVFGRLTVIDQAERLAGDVAWQCECACGCRTAVRGIALRSGHTRSCGCLARDLVAELNLGHGHSRVGKHSSEYRSWVAMRRRCYDPTSGSYHRYGAKGITVCDRWRDDFAAFFADMGLKPTPEHTIDREDNDIGYEPGNCRWATPKEQASNRRRPVRRVAA